DGRVPRGVRKEPARAGAACRSPEGGRLAGGAELQAHGLAPHPDVLEIRLERAFHSIGGVRNRSLRGQLRMAEVTVIPDPIFKRSASRLFALVAFGVVVSLGYAAIALAAPPAPTLPATQLTTDTSSSTGTSSPTTVDASATVDTSSSTGTSSPTSVDASATVDTSTSTSGT